ncbi:thiamine ABC transporter ATP-binding protein [Marinobacter halophilus]|uniref:ABC transporter n=1 Tax=Marinobacter halophilus TaxID=1323740 RepID=A0A2T1KH65_9GAMM|nr:ATP-binding cassette domain-containing protein [Marinobacter halophilus]PSF09466.1 ABC transporter [Marinobacter halophilus]GGC77531.1 thiamine import ATP-binding protein ThiQ [Marinobacter halophilus]
MLELDQLSFRYPGQTTGWQFGFSVAPGHCVAVHGASGTGKSTVLNLIAGFLEPDSGAIRLAGQAIQNLSPWERPVSSVFQEHNLFEHLDVATNIGLGLHSGLKLTSDQRQMIAQSLDRAGLAGFGYRMPAELSGGQRQRIALLRAILRRKPVLLLDEPMTGLDPDAKHNLRTMLLEEKARGAILVLASHDEEDRKVLADQVWNL